jgi:hypothetical protein
MAQRAAQIGHALGGPLGLFLGLRERDRRTKKRLKAKADLDEKQLQKLREDQLRKARTGLLGKGIFDPEQKQRVLSEIGVAPTTEQNLFRDINREGFVGDEEKIFKEEMDRRKQLELLERFGFTKDVLRKGIETGSVNLPEIGQRTEGNIADVAKIEDQRKEIQADIKLTKAKTVTEGVEPDLKRAEIALKNAQAAKATADATEAVQKDKGDKKSVEIKNLDKLVSTLNTELKDITNAKGDPILGGDDTAEQKFSQRVTELRKRIQKTNEILSIAKGLRRPKDIQETLDWYEKGLILTPASWERIVKENRLEKQARALGARK